MKSVAVDNPSVGALPRSEANARQPARSRGSIGHLLLDTIVGDIWWLYPYVDTPFALFVVPSLYRPWWLNFVLHWSFMVEVAVTAAPCCESSRAGSSARPQVRRRQPASRTARTSSRPPSRSFRALEYRSGETRAQIWPNAGRARRADGTMDEERCTMKETQ